MLHEILTRKFLLQLAFISLMLLDFKCNAASQVYHSNELDEKLFIAVSENDIALVSKFLDDGADVNYQDQFKDSALIIASDNGHKEIVGILLKVQGINVSATNISGFTALILAACYGK